jgi:hypothetical protein
MPSPRLCWSTVAILAALITLGAGAAFADGNPISARKADDPVYVLVELTQPPTAVRFHEHLKTHTRANAVAVSHLGVVRAEQTAFRASLAKASLGNLREIYSLQRVFNGVLYYTTAGNLDALKALPGVRATHLITPKSLQNAYSLPFIGVTKTWDGLGIPLHGEKIKIGVIDTGIDQMHADFGGSGDPAAYAANDPSIIETGSFPTAKVKGGWDFAGHDYDPFNPKKAVPVPDPDPMDYAGHGTHVAGTIAGFGVKADGTTYTGDYGYATDLASMRVGPGAAPKAELTASSSGCATRTSSRPPKPSDIPFHSSPYCPMRRCSFQRVGANTRINPARTTPSSVSIRFRSKTRRRLRRSRC